MRIFKKFGVLAAVFALSAIGAANASAAQFTASSTGNVFGKALETQVLTVDAGQVKCTTAETFGPIESTAFTDLHLTVAYRNCTAFGFSNVDISPATYLITASGQVHLLNTVTIDVTDGGCSITVAPQTIEEVKLSSASFSKLKVTFNLTGITYTSTGGACGTSGSNGTFAGANEMERIGGGSLTYDAPAFTYSAPGDLSGKATSTQTFSFNSGQLKCGTAEISGTIVSLPPLSEQHFTVNYKNCTAFGLGGVHVSPATYNFTANGKIHLQNTITVNLTLGGCHLTIGPQTFRPVSYSNNGGRVVVAPNATGITYTTTGGLCGASGSNGTFTGTSEIERVGGGTFSFDP